MELDTTRITLRLTPQATGTLDAGLQRGGALSWRANEVMERFERMIAGAADEAMGKYGEAFDSLCDAYLSSPSSSAWLDGLIAEELLPEGVTSLLKGITPTEIVVLEELVARRFAGKDPVPEFNPALLQELRMEAGMTQAEAAKWFGMSLRKWQAAEAGTPLSKDQWQEVYTELSDAHLQAVQAINKPWRSAPRRRNK